jgi:methylated-DNA-[protein]-cysteine S-methyltransferase
MTKLISKTVPSPIGELTLIADDLSLVSILFATGRGSKTKLLTKPGENDVLRSASRQLAEYFAGKRKSFDLPLDATGTDFQKSVWRTLSKIPFGVTWTYSELAGKIGSPRAMRAVGGANGRNPIPIVVPCHRVIGADGSLTGFAGGMEAKEFLLKLEGVMTRA